MIRKKLIEVALPLEAINEASAREKPIRYGHPSMLPCGRRAGHRRPSGLRMTDCLGALDAD
jgi:adenine-specific DNA methylase